MAKRQTHEPRNKRNPKRRGRAALCALLLASLTVSAVALANPALADTPLSEEQNTSDQAADAADTAAEDSSAAPAADTANAAEAESPSEEAEPEEDSGIATLAYDFTRARNLGYLTHETITQDEFYALFDQFMQDDYVQNTKYALNDGSFVWNGGTRWDCSGMVFYFVTYYLIPYCQDGVAISNLPQQCSNYSDYALGGKYQGTSTWAQITSWGDIIYTEDDINDGTIDEDHPGDMRPGDLIYYGKRSSDDSTSGNVSHVAMYIGDGKYLADRNSGYQSGHYYQVECLSNESTAVDTVEGRGDGARTSSFRLLENANDQEKGYPAIAVIRIFDTVNTGYLTLQKTSANSSITEGNGCYSLSGAVYTVYTDKACTTAATDADGSRAVLTTTSDGSTNTLELTVGTYYVKETAASPGYLLDDTVYTVTITATSDPANAQTLNVSETPAVDTAGLAIDKLDSQSGLPDPQGSATLAGAQFTICYYDGYYSTPEDLPDDATRTWVIQTLYDEESGAYRAQLDDAHKVSGDDWYYDTDGRIVLPLGTITVVETAAPTGYLLEGSFTDANDTQVAAGEIYLAQITQSDESAHLSGGNTATETDRVKRGDVTFKKQDGDDQSTMGSVAFSLTSVTTGESHVLWTDMNGDYSSASAWEPHTQNTNAGESYEDGIWFTGYAEETEADVAVDDSLGALPYDTYILEELPCEANEGRALITTQFTVYRDVTDIGELFGAVDLGTIDNYSNTEGLAIGTTLVNDWTGEHQATIFENNDISLTDTVTFTDLTEGSTYVIRGELMDKETGEVLIDANGMPVTAESDPFVAYAANGQVDITFVFWANGMHGTDTVAYEYLYEIDPDGGEATLVAQHTDLDDEGQTVELLAPTLWTNALSTYSLSNQVDAEEEVSITDMLYLSGLIVGHTYYVYGRAVDTDGNIVTDADGNPIELLLEFVATDEEMELDIMQFVFDATGMEGMTVIFEEYLYADPDRTILITEEEDLGAVEETIYFNEAGAASEKTGTGKSSPVKTGDTAATTAWWVVIAAAGACLALMLITRRRRV